MRAAQQRDAKRRQSVVRNFNQVQDLIERDDARTLRAQLLTAPTLRASLKGFGEPALHVAMRVHAVKCAHGAASACSTEDADGLEQA